MERTERDLITREWEKYKDPKTPVPNILLLGSVDSGKEAFLRQVFGRDFRRVWDIGFNAAVPLPEEDPLGVRILDSHGFEQLDGNSKSVEDYCKALDALLVQDRTADPAQKIHAVWYCITPSAEKLFEQELAILWKICNTEDLQDKLAVVVLQDDSGKKSRGKADLVGALREAIRTKHHNSKIAFSLCNGPDLGPDGGSLMKWTYDQLGEKNLQEAFLTSQVISVKGKRKIAEDYRAEALMPTDEDERQKQAVLLAKVLHVYNMEKHFTPEDLIALVDWDLKESLAGMPSPAEQIPSNRTALLEAASLVCCEAWEALRKDKKADAAALCNVEAIRERTKDLRVRPSPGLA